MKSAFSDQYYYSVYVPSDNVQGVSILMLLGLLFSRVCPRRDTGTCSVLSAISLASYLAVKVLPCCASIAVLVRVGHHAAFACRSVPSWPCNADTCPVQAAAAAAPAASAARTAWCMPMLQKTPSMFQPMFPSEGPKGIDLGRDVRWLDIRSLLFMTKKVS